MPGLLSRRDKKRRRGIHVAPRASQSTINEDDAPRVTPAQTLPLLKLCLDDTEYRDWYKIADQIMNRRDSGERDLSRDQHVQETLAALEGLEGLPSPPHEEPSSGPAYDRSESTTDDDSTIRVVSYIDYDGDESYHFENFDGVPYCPEPTDSERAEAGATADANETDWHTELPTIVYNRHSRWLSGSRRSASRRNLELRRKARRKSSGDAADWWNDRSNAR